MFADNHRTATGDACRDRGLRLHCDRGRECAGDRCKGELSVPHDELLRKKRCAGFRQHVVRGQFIPLCFVPGKCRLIRGISGEILRKLEPMLGVRVLLFRNRASG